MPARRPEHDERVTALALTAARGDSCALEAWVRETQADVWRFLAHLVDSAAADDLTQETYLRAFGSLSRFAGRSSSRAWLLSIARRVAVDRVRAARARPRIAEHIDWQAAAEQRGSSAEPGPDEQVELRILLDQLDPQRREALILTQVLGYSYTEAAQVCSVPVGTIRSRVARAREDLIAARSMTPKDDAI
ncbi:sigma-70 family RNA polymerase sigma factor [Sciscionella marina]|uniref:sigma-70 family RNA polymerase sigma factor n=1 Tax=Sciscionella marina TaxID=508770 RepID=UPI0003745B10|nr:sigma-70 family RNA polymerase sigma factor [Sciscionella marina]